MKYGKSDQKGQVSIVRRLLWIQFVKATVTTNIWKMEEERYIKKDKS